MDTNIGDPGKLLALSTAIALALPFEGHFLDGTPMIDADVSVLAGRLRAWSGMRLGASRWLVLTPGGEHRTAPSSVTVEVVLSTPTDGAPGPAYVRVVLGTPFACAPGHRTLRA